ncbi:MAG: hypothetical protein ACOYB2_19685 [Limnohabitans sp.]
MKPRNKQIRNLAPKPDLNGRGLTERSTLTAVPKVPKTTSPFRIIKPKFGPFARGHLSKIEVLHVQTPVGAIHVAVPEQFEWLEEHTNILKGYYSIHINNGLTDEQLRFTLQRKIQGQIWTSCLFEPVIVEPANPKIPDPEVTITVIKNSKKKEKDERKQPKFVKLVSTFHPKKLDFQ